MPAEIDTWPVRQKFDAQIKQVLTHFNPPKGECLLATTQGMPVGILMLKDLGNGTCEMNRMFVRESARGPGAGRALVQELKSRARDMGFHTMTLSALPRHFEALKLYRSTGFETDPRPSDRKDKGEDRSVLMRCDLRQNQAFS